MARKFYSEEFRRQAVDLYESTAGATFRGIAADLGISRHTLQDWVTSRGGTASTVSTNGATPARTSSGPGVTAPPRPGSPQAGRTGGPGRRRGLSPEDELAALRARVAALQTQNDELVAEQAKLVTEREILRRAAKYFAGETNW